MNAPLFSIVTVTYNAAATLPRTLDSVARQQRTDIEHLIIDGRSADDTVAIAERYKSAAPYPVVVQSEPDRGLYDAMNKALRMATGTYIVFLNAGDTLHAADTLATVATALTTDSPAVVYGDTDIVDGKGRFLRKRHLSAPERLTWRSFRQGMLVCHQAFYARLDIARDIHYRLELRHSADVDWCIRVMKQAEQQGLSLANAHAVLADFMDGGNTTQHHRASLRERFQVMRTHYGLPVTLVMHGWFVLRALGRKISH